MCISNQSGKWFSNSIMTGVIWAQIFQVITENDFKMHLISNTRYLGEKETAKQ